ncbi:zinc finger BED domain-containing 1-like protein [Labeo rohita]|uniref:Zinc finger BED domain-containing 1-like protein n=1 Tax=Labeo rohita TaxID=84645 RepID=A0A498MKJ2_LABRO|nr:zinc finger BED domain-containing 1-like protein [Labeo rohita]RXN32979.1 zinc finger BED domain-containing 1-like protein [Labeo rohita]
MDETMDEDAAGPSRECANPWPHLARLFQFSEQVNDNFRFKCLLCLPNQNFITAYKNSSSNLRKHVKRRHETHLEEYCQLTSTACKRPSEGGTGFKAKQLKLLEAKQVSQKTVDRAILRFIVQGLQSFSLVETPSFQDLIVELQPSSAVMSRTTVRRKIDSATTSQERNEKAALACRQLRGSHTFDALAAVLTDIHAEYEISLKVVRTTTDNGSNFVKAFRVFGQQDENNNEVLVAEGTIEEEELGEDCDASDGEEEVEFMDVEAILEEDDGLQYQLLKHHLCACHLLNLVCTVDVDRANKTEAYKKLSRSAFSKCQALWNKASRSPQNAELIEEHCKLHLVQPNLTRWNSSFMAVERVVRIIRDQGEGSVRMVCAALNVPMYSPADIAFLGEYVTTMSPVAKSLNILQGEVNIQMGWLLPTITTLTIKLEKSRSSLRLCKPLVDALLEGLRKQFESMMSEPELIAAAILVPRFKTSGTSNDTVLQLGLSYIKEHLPEHDEGLRSPDTTSTSSDEDDFFSNVKQTHSHEISKQLDGYLAATAEGVKEYTGPISSCAQPLTKAQHSPASFSSV